MWFASLITLISHPEVGIWSQLAPQDWDKKVELLFSFIWMFSLITVKNISIPKSLNALYLNAQAAIASSIFCLSVAAIPNSLSDWGKRDQWFITLQVTKNKGFDSRFFGLERAKPAAAWVKRERRGAKPKAGPQKRFYLKQHLVIEGITRTQKTPFWTNWMEPNIKG